MSRAFASARRRSRRSFLKGLGAAAAGFTLTGRAFAADTPEEPKLSFLNWDTYIGETTLDDFRGATGIAVDMQIFATNEELYETLRKGNSGYDVIMPGSEMVERMAAAGMLMPLDHTKIPNRVNLAAEFQDADYDPGRKFSMPYTWLVIGIAYRKSKVREVPDSWKHIFDSEAYSGRIAVMEDAAELFRAAYKYLGKSVNATDPGLLREAEALLAKQKPHIRAFHEDDGQDLLMSGECDIVMEYNGDIAQIMGEDDDVGFVVPREGSIRQSDTMCIPKGAPHPEGAHRFIDFLLHAENGKKIFETIQYPSPNVAATALMPDAYKNNPVIFPPAAALAKCEYPRYGGAQWAELVDEAYRRLRAPPA